MRHYTTKSFWLGVCERAIKTAAQTLLSVVTVGSVVWGLDWAQALGLALTAALVSVLTALADPERTDTAVVTYPGGGAYAASPGD